MKKFNMPPGDYGAYSYSGRDGGRARGVDLAKSTDAEAVANALRKSPTYDHFKGKQWWRACDNKSFQDMWIMKGRGPGKTKGEWGLADIVAKVRRGREVRPHLRREGTRRLAGAVDARRWTDTSRSPLSCPRSLPGSCWG